MALVYSPAVRVLHWLSALCVIALFVLGIWMTERAAANLWDDFTNTLYAWHKLIGFFVLLLTVVRIVVKLGSTRPPYPPNVAPAVIHLASIAHRVLYLLLILVPLLGWAGVTAFPALITVGGYNLPAMPGIPKDQALAKQLFVLHGNLALALGALALVHIAAGLHHLFFKKDKVFQRMWFKT